LIYLSGDLPHSIVYQNEEGKWVTDLAYYTSFDEEQDFSLSEDYKINEEFLTGCMLSFSFLVSCYYL